MKDWSIGYTDQVWSNWFKKFPLKKASDHFYHYTSAADALNILNYHSEGDNTGDSNYISLWASHFLFLNDSQELKDGLVKLKTVLVNQPAELSSTLIKQINSYLESIFSFDDTLFAHNSPNHFILCFCENGNLLSQWKYYGRESGISIEFDLANCVFKGNFSDYNEKYLPRNAFSIDYSEEKKKADKFKKLLYGKKYDNLPVDEHDLYGRIIHAIALASFMKDSSFSEERERRLLFAPVYYPLHSETPSTILKKIGYRYTNGKIKPYIEIRIKHKVPERIPIKSITIGPGYNQHLVFNALVKFILSKYPCEGVQDIIMKPDNEEQYQRCQCANVNGIKIRLSDIPFRD